MLFKYKVCKRIPAPYWLFILEVTKRINWDTNLDYSPQKFDELYADDLLFLWNSYWKKFKKIAIHLKKGIREFGFSVWLSDPRDYQITESDIDFIINNVLLWYYFLIMNKINIKLNCVFKLF